MPPELNPRPRIQPQRSRRVRFGVLGVVVLLAGLGLNQRPAVEWLCADVRLKLFPWEDASRPIYSDPHLYPSMSLARFVRELRAAWPEQNVAVVHAAALELATALLHHTAIEAGSITDKKFSPSPRAGWNEVEAMRLELHAADTFFHDETPYVFRRK
jgi:hypothetical protein